MKKFKLENLDGYQELELNKTVNGIVNNILFLETIEAQDNDALDFPEVSVWSIKEALQVAYLAGMNANK